MTRIAAILLAAGRASRFGAAKLAATLGGKPVALHAAATIAGLPGIARIAVTGPDTPDLEPFGFACVPLVPPGAPMSRSVAIGVERALLGGADAVLIALADMPFVPLAHFEALLARFDGQTIATRVTGKAMPPALFGAGLLAELTSLTGDSGARQVLQGADCIDLATELGIDIDTEADFARAAQWWERTHPA